MNFIRMKKKGNPGYDYRKGDGSDRRKISVSLGRASRSAATPLAFNADRTRDASRF